MSKSPHTISLRYVSLCIFIIANSFFCTQCFSQNKLDFGDVIGNDVSACKTKIDGTICKSKNELEISLTGASLLVGRYKTVTITYNNTKWEASELEGDWVHNTKLNNAIVPNSSFEKIFDTLKINGIFTLPDQKELKYNGAVDDGIEYTLSFKAGKKFRSYSFDNPDLYLEMNKTSPEFLHYTNIVDILFKQFKKDE